MLIVNLMKNSLFTKEERKYFVLSICKRILKYSNKHIRPIDDEIGNFISLELRRKFDNDKHAEKLNEIEYKLNFAEKIYEDLIKIKINEECINYPKIEECNYLVNFLVFYFYNLEHLINLTYGQDW